MYLTNAPIIVYCARAQADNCYTASQNIKETMSEECPWTLIEDWTSVEVEDGTQGGV
jgi:hypothetical protein